MESCGIYFPGNERTRRAVLQPWPGYFIVLRLLKDCRAQFALPLGLIVSRTEFTVSAHQNSLPPLYRQELVQGLCMFSWSILLYSKLSSDFELRSSPSIVRTPGGAAQFCVGRQNSVVGAT